MVLNQVGALALFAIWKIQKEGSKMLFFSKLGIFFGTCFIGCYLGAPINWTNYTYRKEMANFFNMELSLTNQ